MKKKLLLIFAVVCCLHFSCKNPLSNIKLYVRNDYYKYTVTVTLKDAAHPNVSITNAVISIGGDAGGSVYDRDGKQLFKVGGDGNVDFSVIPSVAPTPNNPLSFTINFSAPGYIPQTKIVTIDAIQNMQRFTVRLIKSTDVPPGIDVGGRSISMSGGGLARPGFSGSRTTGVDYYIDAYNVAVYIPNNTSFYYYTNPVTGQKTGTQATIMTHDTTISIGGVAAAYHPTTSYYDLEFAQPFHSYTKTPYTGSTISVYYVYEVSTGGFNYSIYTMGGTSNSIHTTQNSGLVQENSLLFASGARQRLLGVYFIGHIGSEDICVSPYMPGAASITGPSPIPGSVMNPDSSWFISYRVDTSLLPMNRSVVPNRPFSVGDSLEVGIDYNTPFCYPIQPPGSVFTPATLNTIHKVIRRDSLGHTRVDCQSTDVGVYQLGITTPFSFNFDASVDTNIMPDPENVYANANINIRVGGSIVGTYNMQVVPYNNKTLSGNIVTPVGYVSSFDGWITDWYWGDSIMSMPLGNSNRVFAGPFSGASYYPQTVRFYYTFLCAASGTPRIVEPTFNGTINGFVGSSSTSANLNVVHGYWKTRGLKVNASTASNITGNACGRLFTISPIFLHPFNYAQIDSNFICSCYFHM